MMNLRDSIYNDLVKIVGPGNVSFDPDILELYSQDQSFAPKRSPDFVITPKDTIEVQEIVRIANNYRVPVTPRSSGTDYCGGAVPNHGGLLIDLRKMNKILNLDKRNWNVTIEPGVTFAHIQEELRAHDLRAATPLVPPSASVLSTYLEGGPMLNAADFMYGNELIMAMEIILPSGDIFNTGKPALQGSAPASPFGPGLNFYRLFQSAQGTLGIVTKMTIKVIPLPKLRRILFLPFNNIENALKAIKAIQRRQIGSECLAFNSFNLAAILAKEDPGDTELLKKGNYIGYKGARKWPDRQREDFQSLRKILPPWTVVLCCSGYNRLPEEKIRYELEDAREAVADVGGVPQHSIGGISGLEEIILDELLQPWRFQKKFGYKGTCHGLFFYSKIENVPIYEKVILEVACKHDYSSSEIGGYVLPIERGRAIYCEYDFHCDPNNPEDREKVRKLFSEVSEELINLGAFFDRPYGPWAEMVYRRAGLYTEYLRRIKRQLDPNNIMNPGKLCF
jgi:FAD/FMN-containing dehydrogenase